MPGTAARYLYLTRHGEASLDESELTDAGRRQAALLGERLRGVPLAAIHHGPLARAEQTARMVGERLDGVRVQLSEAAGDLRCRPWRTAGPARLSGPGSPHSTTTSQKRSHGRSLPFRMTPCSRSSS